MCHPCFKSLITTFHMHHFVSVLFLFIMCIFVSCGSTRQTKQASKSAVKCIVLRNITAWQPLLTHNRQTQASSLTSDKHTHHCHSPPGKKYSALEISISIAWLAIWKFDLSTTTAHSSCKHTHARTHTRTHAHTHYHPNDHLSGLEFAAAIPPTRRHS